MGVPVSPRGYPMVSPGLSPWVSPGGSSRCVLQGVPWGVPRGPGVSPGVSPGVLRQLLLMAVSGKLPPFRRCGAGSGEPLGGGALGILRGDPLGGAPGPRWWGRPRVCRGRVSGPFYIQGSRNYMVQNEPELHGFPKVVVVGSRRFSIRSFLEKIL